MSTSYEGQWANVVVAGRGAQLSPRPLTVHPSRVSLACVEVGKLVLSHTVMGGRNWGVQGPSTATRLSTFLPPMPCCTMIGEHSVEQLAV